MTYQKLALVLTASSLLLSGCIAAAPELTPSETETKQNLTASNYQPAPREIRDNIGTQEVLAQAAFWSHEYNLNPSDLEAAIKFSTVLRKLGNPARAVEVTRTTRALYPKNPYLNAEYAASLLADQQARPALKILDKALKTTPAYGRLWSLKGVALDQMEKYTQARPFYQRALQITPDDPNVMANLGLNHALSGDPHTAKTYLSRAAAHPDASDGIYANLELVETLVAEAAPPVAAPSAVAAPQYRSPAPRSETLPRSETFPRSETARQSPQTRPLQSSQAPRQYGAYTAQPPAQSRTSYKPQAHNPAAPSGPQAVPTSQDVLARIAKNVGPKTAPRQSRSMPPQNRPAQRQQAPQGYPAQGYRAEGRTAQRPPAQYSQYQDRQYQAAQQNSQQGAPQNYGYPQPSNPYQTQPQNGQRRAGYQAPYNQQAPQIRGAYRAPQTPYYGQAPAAQLQQRRTPRRRG